MEITLANIVTLLVGLGGLSGIVAFVMLYPRIRKLQADTTKVEHDMEIAEIDAAAVLSSAALQQMNAALERAQRAEGALIEVRKRLDAVESWIQDYRDVAQLHVAWDHNRIRDLIEHCGFDEDKIPMPPPLIPKVGR